MAQVAMWHGATVAITFRSIISPADGDAVAQFLSSNSWPYHSRPAVSADEAAQIELASESVESYWILDGGVAVGLVRLLDLDDIDLGGSPVFDLRIGEARRGRGIGTRTVNWLTRRLFVTHPTLHRIEATTRADNVAMRIREIARENNVPLVENKPVARALFKVDLGKQVPDDLFKAVAEILAYVYGLKR